MRSSHQTELEKVTKEKAELEREKAEMKREYTEAEIKKAEAEREKPGLENNLIDVRMCVYVCMRPCVHVCILMYPPTHVQFTFVCVLMCVTVAYARKNPNYTPT